MLFLKLPVILLIFSSVCRGNGYPDLKESRTGIPELDYLNTSVEPCDNFYEFTCGNFKNVKPRPDRLPLWDHFLILGEELQALFKEILESNGRKNDPTALKKTRVAYEACINLNYMDELNVPEQAILKDTGNWPLISDTANTDPDFSWNGIGNLIAEYGVQLFFTIQVMPQLFNASENVVYISRDRILNPAIHPFLEENSADFLNAKTVKRSTKHPFEIFLSKIAIHLRNLSGSHKSEELIEKEISEIFEFMKVIQKGGIVNDKYTGTYTEKTVQQLQNWTDTEIGKDINLNWLEYLNGVFNKSGVNVFPNTKVMIADMSTFYGVLNLITQTQESMLKNFAMTRLFTYTAPDSNGVIRSAYDQFRVDMGDVIYNRSEYCIRKVLDYPESIGLSFALTYEYQRRYFDINKIKIASEMIGDLTAAFIDILNESDWLDDDTRENALKKVDEMITLLAFPDFVEDPKLLDKYYENVRVCAWEHFGNSQRLRAFGLASNLALLGKPRNRAVWQLSPLVVNAYYNAQNNRILFPVSMLNPVFYTGEHSALDYGRIGAIIGHEITHGFDSQGMYYDGNGSFTTGWWTPQTKAEYSKRKDCFVEQYGKYYISEIDQYVDPVKTLRENIADNGGLGEAFQAFQKLKSRQDYLETIIEGYTQEQLFFIGFGTLWCTSQTDEYLYKIQNSNYPPARYRVNGAVSNNRKFAEAFNCPVGSNMHPEEKCILW